MGLRETSWKWNRGLDWFDNFLFLATERIISSQRLMFNFKAFKWLIIDAILWIQPSGLEQNKTNSPAYVTNLLIYSHCPTISIHLYSTFSAFPAHLKSSFLRFLDNRSSTVDYQLSGLLLIACTVAEFWIKKLQLLIKGVQFSWSKTSSQCMAVVCYLCSGNVLSTIREQYNSRLVHTTRLNVGSQPLFHMRSFPWHKNWSHSLASEEFLCGSCKHQRQQVPWRHKGLCNVFQVMQLLTLDFFPWNRYVRTPFWLLRKRSI